MPTFTSTYGFVLPVPNSSIDANVWGKQLNLQFIKPLDTYLKQTALSNIGTTAPTVPAAQAGLMWIDNTDDSSWKVQIYDGAEWLTTGTVDSVNHTYTPYGLKAPSLTTQVFTTSGTYTPNADMVYCIVKVQAAGAGGQTHIYAAGGGGGGQYREGIFTKDQIGASRSVTIGTGGAAGVAGTGSSFGTLITTSGGLNNYINSHDAASSTSRGGAGGTGGSGGYYDITGGYGGNGARRSDMRIGGCGGTAALGTGGAGGANTDGGGGGAVAGFQGGGGGGATTGGAKGGNGIIIIQEYCQ